MLGLGRPESMDALLAAGADVEHRDTRGFTPLMIAAWTGRVDAARRLLDYGAKTDNRDTTKGRTALMWAALKGHAAFVRLLLKRGADPALQDNAGLTAAMLAEKHNHPAVVKTLEDDASDQPASRTGNQ